MLTTLREASKRGVPIIAINPLRERGLERFTAPQNPVEMLTLGSTPIASSYYLVKVGGDMAVLKGMMKTLLALDAKNLADGGPGLLDREFIAEHTSGIEALLADIEATSWETIEAASGLPRADIEAVGTTYATANRVPWRELIADYNKIRDGIEGLFPAFKDFNARILHPGGFWLRNAASEREWLTPNAKANFLVYPGLEEDAPAADALTLTTIRSHDQYNTTLYGLNDHDRGITGRRDVIFVNTSDLAKRGLSHGDLVDVSVNDPAGGALSERIMRGLTAVAYTIAEGSVAAYYPEANVLIALDHYARNPARRRTSRSRYRYAAS